MFFTQQKTLLVIGQGGYSVRATGKCPHAPVALLITPNRNFGVTSHETIDR